MPRYPFLDSPWPLAMAHRGVGPAENSLAAFEAAIRLGYRYLETDARVTADGVLVAFHDPRVDRVTDGHGLLRELTYRQLRRLRIAGLEPVAQLAEVLYSWAGIRVNIDVKEAAALAPLARLLADRGVAERVCVGSFSDRRLRAIRGAVGPRLCTAMGPREVARLRAAAYLPALPRRWVVGAAGCVQVPPRFGPVPVLDARLVAAATRVGLPVHAWTIDEADEMKRLLDLGVTGIMTDQAATLRSVLRERGQWPAPPHGGAAPRPIPNPNPNR